MSICPLKGSYLISIVLLIFERDHIAERIIVSIPLPGLISIVLLETIAVPGVGTIGFNPLSGSYIYCLCKRYCSCWRYKFQSP